MSKPSEQHDRSDVASQVASIIVGSVLGVAVGLVLAQTLGGASGLAMRPSRRAPAPAGLAPGFDADDPEAGEEIGNDWNDEECDDTLGERVLEAFANDPVLASRAIEIEAQPGAAVALSGWVDTDRELAYAATVAGGVPGVDHVVSRLRVERNG